MIRILGAEGGLAIDHLVEQYGGTTATMKAAAVSGNTMMNALLERSPDLSLKISSGRTALHYACRTGNQKTVRILLQVISPEARELRTNGGATPLMYAV